MEIFSKRLKGLRAECGKLQADVSNDLSLSRGILSAYENGREPPFETLVAIARYFDVSTDYLLGLSEDRRPAGDDLSRAVDHAAAATAAAGGEAVTASDLLTLATHLDSYLEHGAPAGLAPVDALRSMILSMDQLLLALPAGSTARVLDAVDVALRSVLDVSDITGAYLKHQEGGTP